MATFTAAEALNMALRVEKSGQAFYAAAARRLSEPQVKSLMEELAAWEVKHYETFQRLSSQVNDPPALSGPDWEQYDQYLQAALDNALFKGPDKAVAAAEGLTSGAQALRMAIGFEKDSLLFYYDLRDMMGEAQREMVNQIIREEKKHVQILSDLLRSGSSGLGA